MAGKNCLVSSQFVDHMQLTQRQLANWNTDGWRKQLNAGGHSGAKEQDSFEWYLLVEKLVMQFRLCTGVQNSSQMDSADNDIFSAQAGGGASIGTLSPNINERIDGRKAWRG